MRLKLPLTPDRYGNAMHPMNQKNLNYEIERPMPRRDLPSTMNQKNLNYEIETAIGLILLSEHICHYESKESQL